MDNLTHTLTGLMLARATVGKLAPRAGLLMMVAANAPDCDIWSWAGGTALYLHEHRGLTHSLAFSPVMALLPVAIVWLMEGRRRIPWGWTWLFSWMGVLSHLAMDWTNIYGIRLLLPFSSEWLRLDTVNVVDLAIWAILLLGVAAPALGRLVSSEIGARQGTGRGWATAVLLMLALYEGGRVVAHQRAVETLEARIYEGEAPIRVAALAQTPNPFAWKGVVETQASWIVFYMNLLDDFDPAAGQVYYKAAAHPAIEAAKKTREFGALLAFSTFLTWRVTPSGSAEGVWTVELIDLRFGTPSSPGLSAVAEVDTGGTARSAAVGFGRIQPR